MAVRRVLSIVAALGMLAAALVLGATPAGASSPNSIVVTKVVQGPVPPGTEFTVNVDCTINTFDTDLVFLATGGTTIISTGFGTDTCVLTETQTGGASATTFECEVTETGRSTPGTCQGTNTAVFPAGSESGEITITVTNTFVPAPAPAPPPAPAAAAVEAAPTFTG